MNDYQLNVVCGLLRDLINKQQQLLESNQQIHRELLRISSSALPVDLEEQPAPVDGCAVCGYEEGHHRECIYGNM